MIQPKLAAKALAVNPLKVSQPMGASLAFMGLKQALPLEHGAQGCTAFSKVFFTRHFREPIPLQTTAMDHLVAIIGADQNVVEALRTVAQANQPEIVGLISTGLAEMQGADIVRTIAQFREAHPEYATISIIPVATPDTLGNLESGFALAVEAIVDALVPPSSRAGVRARQVNVLASSMLTSGDVEAIVEWVDAFDLDALVLPNLGDSLDGHLGERGYSAITDGGITREQVASMGESAATLVVGPSLHRAADVLAARTGVPDRRFDSLLGLEGCDAFALALSEISGRAVPRRVERQRAQLLDAMVDCHFPLSSARIGVAGDPDLVEMLAHFLTSLGAEVPVAVTSARGVSPATVRGITIGDLEDFERAAERQQLDLLIANSHAAGVSSRLGRPLLRAGFPLYDQAGGHARTWVGYRGSRQAIFDLTNLLSSSRREPAPYRSIYWQGTSRAEEAVEPR